MLNGILAAQFAVRELLKHDVTLSAEGIFFGTAPREDALPYTLVSLSPVEVTHSLGPSERQRLYRLLVKACCTPEGQEQAGLMVARASELLKNGDGGQSARELLSGYAEQDGWRFDTLIEIPEMEPYSERLTSDVERWHFGVRFNLRISPL